MTQPAISPDAAPPTTTSPTPSRSTSEIAVTPAPVDRAPGWRSGDVLRATAIVVGFLLFLVVLWIASDVFLVLFLGVLFGLAVSAGVDKLARWRIPRGVGAFLVVFSAIGVIVTTGSMIAPTIGVQVNELKTRLPEAADRLTDWINSHRTGVMSFMFEGGRPRDTTAAAVAKPEPGKETQPREGTARAPGDTTSATKDLLGGHLGDAVQTASRYVFSFVSSTVAFIAFTLLIVMISIYVGAEPDVYRSGMLALIPVRSRARVAEVLTAIARVLRRWLLTQLIAMLVIGIVTASALAMIGVRAPLALGLIAGFLEFIPTIGPILSAVPAIAMGFLDSPQQALTVGVVYLIIQQLEGHILIPILMKEGMNLPPVVTIISQAVMAILFGFLGLMVAVPLVATAVVAVRMLYVEDVVDAAPSTSTG